MRGSAAWESVGFWQVLRESFPLLFLLGTFLPGNTETGKACWLRGETNAAHADGRQGTLPWDRLQQDERGGDGLPITKHIPFPIQ